MIPTENKRNQIIQKVDDLAKSIEFIKIEEPVREGIQLSNGNSEQLGQYKASLIQCNKEAQCKLDLINISNAQLECEYNEIVSKTKEVEQEAERQKRLAEENHELKKEIELLEKELYDLENKPPAEPDLIALKVSLYRGLGVEMRIDDDDQIRKATLVSHSHQDILTFQFDPNFSPKATADYIWDFISKK